jgi:anti-sigma-K factor RskA
MANERSHDSASTASRAWAWAWIGWILAVIFLAAAAWMAHHLAFVRGQLDLSEGDASQLRQQLGHAEQIVAVMTTPESAHIVLTEDGRIAHPVGQVSWLAKKGALVLIAGGLHTLPDGKAYELWLIPEQGKGPIPAGLFRPDRDHGATVVLPPIPADTPAKRFLVTIEPEHGSTTPSLPIVMEGGAS